jgi:hypothetical protein
VGAEAEGDISAHWWLMEPQALGPLLGSFFEGKSSSQAMPDMQQKQDALLLRNSSQSD